MSEGNFRADFKEAEVHPLYENVARTGKSNYQSISILSNISKIYERCVCSQLYDYFDKNIFSQYQCSFRKVFSAQHAFLVLIEKMKNTVIKKKICVAILTDLSKAFDCICHNLFIPKLNSYGFDRNALNLIYDNLSVRSQKPKVGSFFTPYLDNIYVASKGSILGSLLFKIDLCDLLFKD